MHLKINVGRLFESKTHHPKVFQGANTLNAMDKIIVIDRCADAAAVKTAQLKYLVHTC